MKKDLIFSETLYMYVHIFLYFLSNIVDKEKTNSTLYFEFLLFFLFSLIVMNLNWIQYNWTVNFFF